MSRVEWGEFKIEELFQSKSGNFDIQKKHINGLGINVVTSGLADYGILGKTDIEAAVFPSGTITVDMFGNAFYRSFEYKMVTHARVFSLIPNEPITQAQGVFISSSLGFLCSKFGFENMCTWDKIKGFYIKLPSNSNSEIDYDFMESFIAELEAERVAELEAYLKASGLDNYELSEEEKQVYDNFENGLISLKDYTFSDIFSKIVQGRRLKKDDQLPGSIPFVMSGTTNTGVVNYISNPVASFPASSITIDIFGNAFYRDYAFGAGDDTGVYWNDTVEYSKESMLFFATAMKKSLHGKYSYGKKLRSSQSFNFKMKLPSNNNEIDFDIMDKLIFAIKKIVIKDVIKYSDKKINATKGIVEK